MAVSGLWSQVCRDHESKINSSETIPVFGLIVLGTIEHVMEVRRSSPLSQLSDPTTESEVANWDKVDAEFSSIIGPVHFRLRFGETEPTEAANTYLSQRAQLERSVEP